MWEDYAPMATMADAHREWHANTGVPMGQPGCPQDACHPFDDYEQEDPTPEMIAEAEAWRAAQEAEPAW